MPLINVLRYQVAPSEAQRYERLVRFVAERARQDKESAEWTAHAATGSQGRDILFVTSNDGYAELASREQPDALIRRLFGEGDGNAVLESLSQAIQASSTLVSTVREDLSSQTLPGPGQAPPLAMVTRIRAARGEALGCEGLIGQVVEAAAKVDQARRYVVTQTVVGDLRTYGVVQPVADPAQLDGQVSIPELLAQAHGPEKGEKAFREGTACIEEAETELVTLLPELSNVR